MDIHPVEGPTHSFKDFLIHILIVTVGILIALGLEGLRESWREHKAIEEAQQSFGKELRRDQAQLRLEMANVRQVNAQLNEAVEHVVGSTTIPQFVMQRIPSINPSLYFFRTTAWESAVSSGILAHMNVSRANRYTEAYLSVKNYQDAQKGAIPAWIAAQSFFASHRTLTNESSVVAEEKLRTFQAEMRILQHLSEELDSDLAHAIGNDESPNVAN